MSNISRMYIDSIDIKILHYILF